MFFWRPPISWFVSSLFHDGTDVIKGVDERGHNMDNDRNYVFYIMLNRRYIT
jgi:hypothetical protein